MKTYSHIYHYAMLVTSRTWEDSTQQKPNEKLFWIYQNSVELAYRHSIDVDFSTTTLSGFIWECAEAAYDVWHYYHFTDDRYSGDAFVEMII